MVKKSNLAEHEKLFCEKPAAHISGVAGYLGTIRLTKTPLNLFIRFVEGGFPFSIFREFTETEEEIKNLSQETKIETENLCLFILPSFDDFFVRVYERSRFNAFLKEAERGIRILGMGNEPKFVVPDGGKIKITDLDGHSHEGIVRFIDSTHFLFRDMIFHISEFAACTADYKVEELK